MNIDLKRVQLHALVAAMDFLENFSAPLKPFLRFIANAPVLSDHLMVIPRAYLGATAFEIHDVDLEKGRIGIGGVEEIIFGSKIVELLHREIEDQIGEAEKNEVLYNIGYKLTCWEVSQSLKHGRWAPEILQPLIVNSTILEDIKSDKLLAEFFVKILNTMSRLITDEGGWGHLTFKVRAGELRVYLSHSQEATWLPPSDQPVCHLYSGIVAGYASTISGQKLKATEVACKASGAEKCEFHLEKEISQSSL